eukprot:TRINITY_DN85_c0_g1_i1.p2 TRINITY_DN85_c0_g1~~TRINITY_DN85_c0_g1_i1.p2  ORF type:complete len:124 (+),score=49.67 TRINITY_DN85_c0_g1_i1:203-574(+)
MKAIDYSDFLFELSDEDKKLTKEISTACHNNVAQCYLNMKKGAQALEYCDKCINHSPEPNSKALYRKGLALAMMGEHEKSIEALQEAHAIDPENARITKEIAKVKKAHIDFKNKEKGMYAKMF